MNICKKRTLFPALALGILLTTMLGSADAQAQTRDSYARWNSTAPQYKQIAVPVQIGVGPVGYLIGTPNIEEMRLGGPILEDQLFHTGLRISLTAVISQQLIRENPELVPRQYRNQVAQMGEIRMSPMIASLIPSSLFISPKFQNTGIFGSTWTLFRVGLAPVTDPIRVGLSAGLLGSYAYIYSDLFESTHFLRPGIDAALDIEIPIAEDFLISFGWASQFYLPQRVGGSILEVPIGEPDTIWHMGQLYLQFHVRVPYIIERQIPQQRQAPRQRQAPQRRR